MQSGNGTAAPPDLSQLNYSYDCAANRAAVQSANVQFAVIGGSKTTGDTLTVTVHDAGLSGGTEAVNYTVQAGDTLSTIAAGLAAAITADANLQSIGVNATSTSTKIHLKSCSSAVTSYTESTSGGATETISLGVTNNFVENAVIGGTKTTGDSLTITVYDPALSGGHEAVPYSVLSTDTLTTIATGLKAAINADSHLSGLGVTATSASAVVTVKSTSSNATTYVESTNSGATETITLSVNQNSLETVLLGGTLTVSDALKINVYDSGLTGGLETVTYTTMSGDTPTSMATGLKNAINSDSNLQGLGVSATSSGAVITITSNSPNATTYRNASASTVTEIMNFGLPVNGIETAAIGGSKTTSDVLTITVFDAGLSGGSKSDSYTVLSGDTLSSIASGLASAINGDSSLSAIGVSASAVSTVVNITSTSVNNTGYSQSTNSGATETITLGNAAGVAQASFNCLNELTAISAGGPIGVQSGSDFPVKSAVVNPNQTATIGGTIHASDVLWLSVHDKGLSQAENVSYTVLNTDTTTTIATALASAINGDSNLSSLGVTATSSGAVVTLKSTSVNPTFYSESTSSGATETISIGSNIPALATTLAPSTNFIANPVLSSGANTNYVTAVSGGGTAKTNVMPIKVASASSQSLSYNFDGNMTSDGTNSYAYDAENRLVTITYPGAGNNTAFTYDPLGRCSKIVETVSSSVTSTKQFIWCGNQRCEVRDSGGTTILAQFFPRGETISGTSYYFTKDHLGSVREMTDSSGNIQAELAYDPYGRPTQLAGSLTPDMGFTGAYLHARSGLSLTLFRAYSPGLGRWLSRDQAGGINRYAYVGGNPISLIDPLGLQNSTQMQGTVEQNVDNGGSSGSAGTPSFIESTPNQGYAPEPPSSGPPFPSGNPDAGSPQPTPAGPIQGDMAIPNGVPGNTDIPPGGQIVVPPWPGFPPDQPPSQPPDQPPGQPSGSSTACKA